MGAPGAAGAPPEEGIVVAVGFVLALVLATGCLAAAADACEATVADALVIGAMLLGGGGLAAMAPSLRRRLGDRFFSRSVSPDPDRILADLLTLADIAHRKGVAALSDFVHDGPHPFFAKAITVATGDIEPFLLQRFLDVEIDAAFVPPSAWTRLWASFHSDAPSLPTAVASLALLGWILMWPAAGVVGVTPMFPAAVCLCVLPFTAVMSLVGHRRTSVMASDLLAMTMIQVGIVAIRQGDHPRDVNRKLRDLLPPSALERLSIAAA